MSKQKQKVQSGEAEVTNEMLDQKLKQFLEFKNLCFSFTPGMTLFEVQKRSIIATITYCRADFDLAAKMLGISKRTIYNKFLDWEKRPTEKTEKEIMQETYAKTEEDYRQRMKGQTKSQ